MNRTKFEKERAETSLGCIRLVAKLLHHVDSALYKLIEHYAEISPKSGPIRYVCTPYLT